MNTTFSQKNQWSKLFCVSDAPALPINISCTYLVKTNESRTVNCTWNRGHDTHLTTRSSLWWVWQMSTCQSLTCCLKKSAPLCFRVRTASGKQISNPVAYGVAGQDSHLLASLDVPGSVQQISVWIESQNPLGSSRSAPLNYTLSDIGEMVKTGLLLPLSFKRVMCNTCFQISDAAGSPSQLPHLLFSRVHRPRGAVCDDCKAGDPVQLRSRSMDVASRLGKSLASQTLRTFLRKRGRAKALKPPKDLLIQIQRQM